MDLIGKIGRIGEEGKMAKVLIVEDDLAISNLYKAKLTKEGFTVFTAYNGKEGLEAVKKDNPDIILLDVMMPVMSGFEMLKALRNIKEYKETPVIILSNYGETDQMTEGFLDGATDYLIKVEHTPDDVVQIVTDTLDSGANVIADAFEDK
jgi:two-component system alkaline phosphatase synthesis response regulator PhoP/two-component system response regulator VicR